MTAKSSQEEMQTSFLIIFLFLVLARLNWDLKSSGIWRRLLVIKGENNKKPPQEKQKQSHHITKSEQFRARVGLEQKRRRLPDVKSFNFGLRTHFLHATPTPSSILDTSTEHSTPCRVAWKCYTKDLVLVAKSVWCRWSWSCPLSASSGRGRVPFVCHQDSWDGDLSLKGPLYCTCMTCTFTACVLRINYTILSLSCTCKRMKRKQDHPLSSQHEKGTRDKECDTCIKDK